MKQHHRSVDAAPDPEMLRALMDDYLGNILIMDRDGFIVFASNSVCADLGCRKEDLIGRHKSFLTEEGYTERSISDIVRKSGTKTFLSVKAYRTGNVMFASSETIPDGRGGTAYVVNRSETERALLNKINTIYEERFRTDHAEADGRADAFSGDYIVKSAVMQALFREALGIAGKDLSVVITGDPGVGKEVLARYIYQNSLRADKPFLPVNCAAIPKELMESEFFGYEKGAFTGARTGGKPGIFEIANGGTLFLDEIGELPLSLQPKLLRVLDAGEVRRIGGERPVTVDVRIICATNRNLEEMVEKGEFRADLYYRINVVPLRIPPLRERPEDTAALAGYFLERFNHKYHTKKVFAMDTLANLKRYAWPGNIRELRNYIERNAAVSLSDVLDIGEELAEKEVQEDIIIFPEDKSASSESPGAPSEYQRHAAGISDDARAEDLPLKEALLRYEKHLIADMLEACDGNVTKAAERLQIARSRIYRRMG